MSILSEINEVITTIGIPVETGYFSEKAPDEYCVVTPVNESFEYRDNKPQIDIHEVRISLFSKQNYLNLQKQIVNRLIEQAFTITEIRFIEFEQETNYYHVAIDVAKHYEMEEE